MKIKRVKTKERFDLEVKRLKLPYKITSRCPTCKKKHVFDFSGGQYLSYPVLGEPEEINFYCEDDHTEWAERVVLDVTLVPA